jgi:HSP20 family molecular chaperone IbpA
MLSAIFNTRPLPFHTFHYNSLQKACSSHQTRSHRAKDMNTKTYFTVIDQGDAYILTLQLPELTGRKLTDLELSCEGNTLSLSIPELILSETDHLEALWEEIPSTARHERFRIPSTVNAEQVSATLHGEQLEIKLPKRTPIKHTIHISPHIAS